MEAPRWAPVCTLVFQAKTIKIYDLWANLFQIKMVSIYFYLFVCLFFISPHLVSVGFYACAKRRARAKHENACYASYTAPLYPTWV